MDVSVVYVILLMLVLNLGQYAVEGYCSTRGLSIPNGSYYLRSGNSLARYECNRGFQLYGVEQIVCFGDDWSSGPPQCIANTCQEVIPTKALLVTKEFQGSVLKFSCDVMYRLNGSSTLICDGTDWSHRQPTCDPWTPPLSCDFEHADLCGWSHHESGDQEWKRNTGSTPTSRTGPSYDHTYGIDGNGYYMYFETSSPTRTNHKAILMSPLYAPMYSQPRKCFNFFYHIHGEKDIGDLEVFIKPQSADLKRLSPLFKISEAKGDEWLEHTITVPRQTETFQIVFVATRGSNYRSDYAIDDVELTNCTDTIHQESTQATEENTSTTVPFTTAIRHTTQPTAIKTTMTSTTTTTTTTIKSTTMKPPTTTTMKPPPTTTMKTDIPSTTRSTTTYQQSTYQTTKDRKLEESTSLKPVINPNLHLLNSQAVLKEDRHGTTKIVYIIIGVGLVIAVAGLVGVGIYCYRRHQKMRRQPLDSLSSSNPLYRVVNGEEAINFAIDPYENL